MGGPSPCASCKRRRRRCTTDCIFAPYFPSDDPQKFDFVRNVFSASNVSKMLQGLPVHQRGDVVSSLVYEAKAWETDRVYGCVGYISFLKNQLAVAQNQVTELRKQLAAAQAQEIDPNHEADKGGKGKEAFETASGVAAGDKKHEAAESSDAAVKRMRFTFDLNQFHSGEDEHIMP